MVSQPVTLTERAGISHLEKGLFIVAELAVHPNGLTVGKLAERVGIARATVYRICEILEHGHWITRIGEDGGRARTRVQLGPRMFGVSVLVCNIYDREA